MFHRPGKALAGPTAALLARDVLALEGACGAPRDEAGIGSAQALDVAHEVGRRGRAVVRLELLAEPPGKAVVAGQGGEEEGPKVIGASRPHELLERGLGGGGLLLARHGISLVRLPRAYQRRRTLGGSMRRRMRPGGYAMAKDHTLGGVLGVCSHVIPCARVCGGRSDATIVERTTLPLCGVIQQDKRCWVGRPRTTELYAGRPCLHRDIRKLTDTPRRYTQVGHPTVTFAQITSRLTWPTCVYVCATSIKLRISPAQDEPQ